VVSGCALIARWGHTFSRAGAHKRRNPPYSCVALLSGAGNHHNDGPNLTGSTGVGGGGTDKILANWSSFIQQRKGLGAEAGADQASPAPAPEALNVKRVSRISADKVRQNIPQGVRSGLHATRKPGDVSS
jgi:hypothetical protein